MAARRRRGAGPAVVAVSDGAPTIRRAPHPGVDRRGPSACRRPTPTSAGAGRAARRRRAVVRPRGPADDRQQGPAERAARRRGPSSTRSCRLLPLARLARDAGALPERTVAALERLAARLDRFDDGEPPARLHGDLWAGNRLVDVDGRSWLIDPAAHGGHREFDLAMMRLFGGFSDACFRAYEEAHPLRDGWADRVAAPPDRAARRARDQVRRRIRRGRCGSDRELLSRMA